MKSFDVFMNEECIERFSHNKEFCQAFEVGALAAAKWIREGLHDFHMSNRTIESQVIKYWARHQMLCELDTALKRVIEEGKI